MHALHNELRLNILGGPVQRTAAASTAITAKVPSILKVRFWVIPSLWVAEPKVQRNSPNAAFVCVVDGGA